VKKNSLAFSLLVVSFVIAFFSCKKINEATELGGDLIPAVDNVKTFEVSLEGQTNNLLYNDLDSMGFFDDAAIGHLNDPEFGTTHANAYFDIGRFSYGSYPFIVTSKDSVVAIDSVILSLAYTGGYGDTSDAAQLTFRVFEIAQGPEFTDTSFYSFKNTNDFPTTGGQLGSKTFSFKSIRDTNTAIRPGDTVRTPRVLRIPLSNTIGDRFRNYDTANQYKTDTAFKAAFKGLAIKSDNAGNSLAYFDLSDNTKTKLIIYYKARINGKDSTASSEFYHLPIVPTFITYKPANFRNGQANVIKRTYAGNAAATLNNGIPNEYKLYVQSGP